MALAAQLQKMDDQLAAFAAENDRLHDSIVTFAALQPADKAAEWVVVVAKIKDQAAAIGRQQTFLATAITWQQNLGVAADRVVVDMHVAAQVAADVAKIAQERVMLAKAAGIMEIDLATEVARQADEAANEAAREAARQANEAARQANEAARQANEAARQANEAAREANKTAQQ